MKVYRCRNKKTGEFWQGCNKKSFFKSYSGAKNSYTKNQKWPNQHTFDDQDEYEIVVYELVEINEYADLKDFLFWCNESYPLTSEDAENMSDEAGELINRHNYKK